MRSPNITEWNKKKTKEIYSLSNQMLNLLGQFYEFQLQEMRSRVDQVFDVELYQSDAHPSTIREKQLQTVVKSVGRLARYQKNTRQTLNQVQQQIEASSKECLHHSVDLIADFIEEGDNKMPIGAKSIASVVRVTSEIGDKSYKTGVISAAIAADNVDHFLDKYIDDELE
jgi:hypothetical protein